MFELNTIGLIGQAITLTKTSPCFGTGTGTYLTTGTAFHFSRTTALIVFGISSSLMLFGRW